MANPFADFSVVVRHLGSRLLVADLKDILKDLSLSTSGNKKPLIERITNQLNIYKATNDVAKYNILKAKIMHGTPQATRQEHGMPWGRPPHGDNSYYPQPQIMNRPPSYAPNGYRPPSIPVPPQTNLQFAHNPFYDIRDRLSGVVQLPFANRNNVTLSFILPSAVLDLLNRDPVHHRIALVGGNTALPSRALMMELPNPAEITLNGRRISANLRGMKNKPGTIPPVNITSNIDRTPRMANRVDVAYAQNDATKRFCCQVVFLKVQTVDELVSRIKAGRRFTKESVLQKLQRPADDEIQLGSFDLSLKDPLSYMRISLPCRSVNCKHQQCFDAFSFLSINEQTPQWICSICQIHIPNLEMLAVDGYFQDILDNVDHHVDTIAVDSQGCWSIAGSEESSEAKPTDTPEPKHVFDLADLDEESEVPIVKPEEQQPSLPPLPQTQSPPRSRETTQGLMATAAANAKRKQVPICIDLTEDSDEEIPASPAKKMKTTDDSFTELKTPLPIKDLQPPTSAHAWPAQPQLTLPPPPTTHIPPANTSDIQPVFPFPSFSPKSLPQAQTSMNIQPVLPGVDAITADVPVSQDRNTPETTEDHEHPTTPVLNGTNGTHDVSPPIVTPGSRTRTSAPQFPFDSDDFSDFDGTVY